MLIGLHGLAGSGKDTTYAFIAEWAEANGYTPRREAFADRLKISAARALGYMGDDPLGFCNTLKDRGHIAWYTQDERRVCTGERITGRQYLQWYGTEAHRAVFGQDFWIDMVMATYRGDEEILVVTDVRFPNEAEAIRAQGGQVWLILRPEIERGDAHISERVLSTELIDYEVWNVHGLDYLKTEVRLHMENAYA